MGDDEAPEWRIRQEPGFGVEPVGDRGPPLPVDLDEGVDDRFGRLGPPATGVEQFAGGKPTALQQPSLLEGCQVCRIHGAHPRGAGASGGY